MRHLTRSIGVLGFAALALQVRCGSQGQPATGGASDGSPGSGEDSSAAGSSSGGSPGGSSGSTSGGGAPALDGSAPSDATGDALASDAFVEGSPPVHDAASSDAGGCAGPRPGPTNTGVPPGTVLTPSGSITVSTAGAVVEGLDIQGTITVLANNVTIRKVRITTGDYYPVRYFDNNNTGLLVEDTEIIGTSGNVTSGIAFRDYTARRVNVHGSADGLKADANVLIEDCYVHDLSNGPGEHNDGVQSTGGKGVTIRHSSLSGGSNSCVQTGDENAATENLTIDCNWLDGGGYTLNIRGTGATKPRNTRVTNNRFGRDAQYGPWVIDDPNPVVTGNVYDDSGAPIPYP
jgi:hypothetical protein